MLRNSRVILKQDVVHGNVILNGCIDRGCDRFLKLCYLGRVYQTGRREYDLGYIAHYTMNKLNLGRHRDAKVHVCFGRPTVRGQDNGVLRYEFSNQVIQIVDFLFHLKNQYRRLFLNLIHIPVLDLSQSELELN